jgi:hypothetical protein
VGPIVEVLGFPVRESPFSIFWESMSLIIVAAQSRSVPGNISQNVARHLRFGSMAANSGAQLRVFPELSLTGYEPAIARSNAISPGSSCLYPDQIRIRDDQASGAGGVLSGKRDWRQNGRVRSSAPPPCDTQRRVSRRHGDTGLSSRSTTHSGYTSAELDESGPGQGLVRFSIGIEQASTLISDLRQALEGLGAA